jgi:Domain of unknown function (DUF4157)/Lysine-specific metallo-endopeptidase
MLQVPAIDKQTKPEASCSAVEREPERLKGLTGWGARSVLGVGRQAYGNQAALQMLRRQQQILPAVSPVQGGVLQRKCACGNSASAAGTCAECQEKQEMRLQRKAAGSEAVREAPSIVREVLSSSGQPLDAETRSLMESRFRYDFSHVRIHTDTKASESANAINALAYTFGDNIVFGARHYSPKSKDGQRLLAHELTHVVQQNGAQFLSHKPTTIGLANDAAEQEADRNAAQLQTETPLKVSAFAAKATALIQRYGHTSSCTASDLSGIVWPGDYAMRQMVAKAIRVLSATPINPAVAALFPKYFMTATPPIPTILAVFRAVQTIITRNDYIYECEHNCGSDEAAYVRHRLRYIGINPNLHLCINHMSGYTLACNASLILHEMTHYAAHLDDEATACGACSTAGCPASLSPIDALDNTYSYADFAFELYPMAV